MATIRGGRVGGGSEGFIVISHGLSLRVYSYISFDIYLSHYIPDQMYNHLGVMESITHYIPLYTVHDCGTPSVRNRPI